MRQEQTEWLLEVASIAGYHANTWFVAKIVCETIQSPHVSEYTLYTTLILFNEWRYEYKSAYKKILHGKIVKLWSGTMKSQ